MKFLDELKRRNVLRVAGLYLGVGAWVAVQVSNTWNRTTLEAQAKIFQRARGQQLSRDKLEAEIERLETALHKIDFDLAEPKIFSNGEQVKSLKADRDRLQTELKPLEREWSRRAEE